MDLDPYDGVTPPFYTIRYDADGTGLKGYALPGTSLGVCGIAENLHGFQLSVRVVDTSGRESANSSWMASGTLGDFLLPLVGMADLRSLDVIDIAIDPPESRNVEIGGITASGCGEASIEAGLYAGLKIAGQAGCSYRIESTTNVEHGPWTPVDTVLLSNSTHLWLDTNAPVSGSLRRFYRAVRVE